MKTLPMLQVGNVVLSADVLTESFCCDLSACHGACCVEGESGAPLDVEEVGRLEAALPAVSALLSEEALAVIEKDGVACVDSDGDLVTAIVDGKDCVFTCHAEGCCYCSIDVRYREGRTPWRKPASCYLYPLREKQLGGGLVGLNYHRWDICAAARRKGRALHLPLYVFLKEPLVERFGAAWYAELELTVSELRRQGLL